MSGHNHKERKLIKIIKLLRDNKFNVIEVKNGYKIEYIPNNEFHSYHHSADRKGYHPLRRWVYYISGLKI